MRTFEGKDIKATNPTQIEMDWSHMNNDYPFTLTTDEIVMAKKVLKKLQDNAY